MYVIIQNEDKEFAVWHKVRVTQLSHSCFNTISSAMFWEINNWSTKIIEEMKVRE